MRRKRQRICREDKFAGPSGQYRPVEIGNEPVIRSRILTYLTCRFAFAIIFPAWVLFSVNACTVKHHAIPPGKIPKVDTVT
ncbi:MAG: hypothetical protein PVG06_20585, partial [Desulfobacterales bacterium]